jgi:hypothetical protein
LAVFALLVLFALFLLPGAKASAQVVNSGICGAEGGNVTWTLDDTGLVTISGTGAMNDYSTFDANRSPFYQNEAVQRVVIEGQITNIGKYLFSGCEALTDVSVTAPVAVLGGSAFSKCGALAHVDLPDSVESIQHDVFFQCSSLTGTLTLPADLTTIGDRAFTQSGIVGLVIPASVTEIGTAAFSSCTGLATLTFPASLNSECSIGERAFYGCTGLTSLSLPEGVTELGESAFQSCSGLTRIALPASLQNIGKRAFDSCKMVSALVFPSAMNGGCVIADSAFNMCQALTTVTLPTGITSLGEKSFGLCAKLSRIVLPSSVESVGNQAFFYDQSLNLFVLGEATAFGEELFNPDRPFTGTIYCVLDSTADEMARAKSYTVRYIDPDLRPTTEYAFLTLPLGKRQEMTARYSGTAQNVVFTWQSTDTKVLTVETSAEDSTVCVVKAVGLGTAHILLTNSQNADLTDMEITVYLDFAFEAMSLKQGRRTQLFSDLPQQGEHSVNRLVVFSSADPTIASVDQFG